MIPIAAVPRNVDVNGSETGVNGSGSRCKRRNLSGCKRDNCSGYHGGRKRCNAGTRSDVQNICRQTGSTIVGGIEITTTCTQISSAGRSSLGAFVRTVVAGKSGGSVAANFPESSLARFAGSTTVTNRACADIPRATNRNSGIKVIVALTDCASAGKGTGASNRTTLSTALIVVGSVAGVTVSSQVPCSAGLAEITRKVSSAVSAYT